MSYYSERLALLNVGAIECPCGEVATEFINGDARLASCARCADPDNMTDRQMNRTVGGARDEGEAVDTMLSMVGR